MANSIDIPQALWLRLYTACFGLLWAAAMIAFWINVRTIGEALVALFMTGYGLFVCLRVYTAFVRTDGNQLIVRNYLSTKVFEKQNIDSFSVGNPQLSTPWGRTIFVRLKSNKIFPLHVTLRTGVGRRSKKRQAERLAAMQAWLGR